jgi:hypothetical protein
MSDSKGGGCLPPEVDSAAIALKETTLRETQLRTTSPRLMLPAR